MFKFITYNNQEVAISLLNQLLIDNQKLNHADLFSGSDFNFTNLVKAFKPVSYLVPNNSLSRNRLKGRDLKFEGISSEPKILLIAQINRALIQKFFTYLEDEQLQLTEIEELQAKHLLLGFAKNAEFSEIKPLQSAIAQLTKAELNDLVKLLFKHAHNTKTPRLNLDSNRSESYIWILTQLLQVLIATQENAYLNFLYKDQFDFNTPEINELNQYLQAVKTAITQGKSLAELEQNSTSQAVAERGVADDSSELEKFKLNNISYETYFQAVALQSDIQKYLVNYPDFVYELLNSNLDFSQGEQDPAVQEFIAKFFIADHQDEYLLAKLDLIHKGLLLTTRYQVASGVEFFNHNWKKLIEQIVRACYQNPDLSKYGNLSVYSHANSADDFNSVVDSGSANDFLSHRSTAELSHHSSGASFNSAQCNDASTTSIRVTELAAKLTQIEQSLSLNNFDAINFINNSEFVISADDKGTIREDHLDLYLFNVRFYAPYQLNFLRKAEQVFGYNIYIFNQSPTYHYWGIKHNIPKLELFYRKQQEYVKQLGSQDTQKQAHSYHSQQEEFVTSSNNNLLSAWGKQVQRSELIVEDLAVEKIFFYNYDLSEVIKHQQQNWLNYRQALVQSLNKVAVQGDADSQNLLVAQQQALAQELSKFNFNPLPNLLTQLKHHVLNYEALGLQDQTFVFQQGDDSIRIHSAYSKRRELEYAYNYILQALTENPDLKLSDILVVAPEIETYRNFIQQIFSQKKSLTTSKEPIDKRYLPFQIFSEQAEDEVKDFLENLFNLDAHKFSLVDLQVFLNSRFAKDFYQITKVELDLLARLLKEHATSERFALAESSTLTKADLELDASLVAHQLMAAGAGEQGLQLSQTEISQLALDFNSWQHVLFRAELDAVIDYEEDENFFAGVGLEATHEAGAGIAKLSLAINDLFTLVQFKQQRHSLEEWLGFFHTLILQFFPEERYPEQYSNLLKVYKSLKDNAYNSASLKLLLSRQPFLNQLFTVYKQNNRPRLDPNYLTFASLSEYQAQSYKVLVVLGMNAGEFPSHQTETELDLSAYFLKSTNFPTQLERYSYSCLEFLLNTTDKVLFSYIGQTSDNKERKPAQLLEHLITFLDNHCGALEFKTDELFSESEIIDSDLVIKASELSADSQAVYQQLGFNQFTWQDLKASLVIDQATKFSQVQLIKGSAYSFSDSNYKLELNPWQTQSLAQDKDFAAKLTTEATLGLHKLCSAATLKPNKNTNAGACGELSSYLSLNQANFFYEWLTTKESKHLDLPFIDVDSLIGEESGAYQRLLALTDNTDFLQLIPSQAVYSDEEASLTKISSQKLRSFFSNPEVVAVADYKLDSKRDYSTKSSVVGDPDYNKYLLTALLKSDKDLEQFMLERALRGLTNLGHYHKPSFANKYSVLEEFNAYKQGRKLFEDDNLKIHAEDLADKSQMPYPQAYQLKSAKQSLYFRLDKEFLTSLEQEVEKINSEYKNQILQQDATLKLADIPDLIPAASLAILAKKQTTFELEVAYQEYYPLATEANPCSGEPYLFFQVVSKNFNLSTGDALLVAAYMEAKHLATMPKIAYLQLSEDYEQLQFAILDGNKFKCKSLPPTELSTVLKKLFLRYLVGRDLFIPRKGSTSKPSLFTMQEVTEKSGKELNNLLTLNDISLISPIKNTKK